VPKNGKLLLAYLKNCTQQKEWSLSAVIITLKVEWDIKTVVGFLYMKLFFLCGPVPYSAKTVLPTPKKSIPSTKY
jgi:hypothetical protein